MNVALVKNAERMMTKAELKHEGIEGHLRGRGVRCGAFMPWCRRRRRGSGVAAVELPSAYELALETPDGKRAAIPWDFVRHYCDDSYRPNVERIAAEARASLGGRIRRLRESAGLTQEGLAAAAGIGRVTLVRVEKGEQSPRFETLSAVADALGRRVSELVVDERGFSVMSAND